MLSKPSTMLTVPIFASVLAFAVPAFGQDMGVPASQQPASQSMRQAGQSAENAASDSGQAVEHAAHGVATAAADTKITAKVKTAIRDDKSTDRETIHVATVAGVVTLKGVVRSEEASRRAEELAQQTSGVKGVNNRLAVTNTGAMN